VYEVEKSDACRLRVGRKNLISSSRRQENLKKEFKPLCIQIRINLSKTAILVLNIPCPLRKSSYVYLKSPVNDGYSLRKRELNVSITGPSCSENFHLQAYCTYPLKCGNHVQHTVQILVTNTVTDLKFSVADGGHTV
jgi:hypothetical protein